MKFVLQLHTLPDMTREIADVMLKKSAKKCSLGI